MVQVHDYNRNSYVRRTKIPTIVCVTDQWFASVEGFRNSALDVIEMVHVHDYDQKYLMIGEQSYLPLYMLPISGLQVWKDSEIVP